MEDLMKSLVSAAESPAGQQAISGVVGNLLGGNQQGGGQNQQVGQVLGALEQVIGGTPGSGNLSQGTGSALGANDPIMLMLQPVVGQLAKKANISPEIATVVISLVVHYLLSSHPLSGKGGALNLGALFQELTSGGISADTLHNSGMVNDVMQATGLGKTDAVKALDSTFSVLSKSVSGSAGTSGSSKLKSGANSAGRTLKK